MKSCPICGATATNDAQVCFECLYDWTRLSCDAIQPDPADQPLTGTPKIEPVEQTSKAELAPDLDGFEVVVDEPSEGSRRFSFAAGSLHVGRLPTNEIVLNDPTVSRRHLHLFYEQGGFWVEDFGALNPTKVNGSVILGRAPVREGDEIKVRSATLRIRRI